MTSAIVGMIESAIRAKAPIVGIPQDGEAPFCFKRAILADSLKGLKIIDAGIQLALDGKPENSRLVIYAAGAGVKAVRSLVPMYRGRFLLDQWAWADGERKRLGRKSLPKVSGKEKKLIQLRKQLAKLGPLSTPRHPMLDDGYNGLAARMEHDARAYEGWQRLVDPANGYLAEGTTVERPLTLGEQWAKWKAEADTRRWIQTRARMVKAGKMTTAQLYKALEAKGIKARRWSDLNTRERERCKDLFGFLGTLWEFCGLAGKPYWFKAEAERELGAKHYEYWLEGLHKRKEIQSMIEGIEAI